MDIMSDDKIVQSDETIIETTVDESASASASESESVCESANVNENETNSNNIKTDNPENIEIEPKYRNLVLSGGSIKGISHLGAIKRLIEKNLIDLKKLDAVAGTSVGSIIALFITLGFTIEEIWQFVYLIDLKRLINPNFLILLKKCGVETGHMLCNIFEDILTKKTGTKHINFKQLYDSTKIHLIIVGSCLTTKQPVYYDHINTPYFKVSVAIRISISLPGLFTPVVIDDKKYIDGGILNNYAMNLFEDKMEKTIGLLICGEYNTDYKYFEEYFMAIMNLFMYHFYQKTADQYRDNTVYIDHVPREMFQLLILTLMKKQKSSYLKME